MELLSIVIPVYVFTNVKLITMTQECIHRAKNNTNHKFELVIVETCTDYFREEADIHIFEKAKSTVTKSINRGLKAASGQFVAVLTNDVYVEPDWLSALRDCFNHSDCGAATIATTQLGHKKEDKIEEGVWGSVFMMRNELLKELDYLDEQYVGSWDDSDLWMRMYLKGLKMYRNHRVVVEHLVGQTHYKDVRHELNYENNKQYFLDKFKEYKDHPMYKVLVEGHVM